MALVFIALAALAAYLSHGSSAFVPAVVNLLASVWANGVIANFSREESDEVPNWAANVSMATVAGSIVLIVISLV